MAHADSAATQTLGLMMVGASVLSGAMLLGLYTESMEGVADDARVAAEGATYGLVPAVEVRSLAGVRNPGETGVHALRAYLSAVPASDGLALRALAIEVRAGGSAVFTLGGGPGAALTWRPVLDPEPPLHRDDPVVTSRDLVEVTLPTAEAGLVLAPRIEGRLVFLTPQARPVQVPFRVPVAPQDREIIELHGQAQLEPAPSSGPRWTFHPLDEP